jgi:hypothetical protein
MSTLPSFLVPIFMQCTVRTDAHVCRSHVFAVCHKNVAFIVMVEDCQISGALCVCVWEGGGRIHLQATQKRLCGRTRTDCRVGERAILCALGLVEFVHEWNEHMHSSFACRLQEGGCDTVCDITGDEMQVGRLAHHVAGPLTFAVVPIRRRFVSARLLVLSKL